MENEDKRQYELTFILSPNLEEKDVGVFEQEVEKKIKELGGDLKKRERLEKRDLAYPIKKFQFGYYLVISFLLDPQKLEELSKSFQHEKNLLRYIINFIEQPSRAPAKEERKKKPQPKVDKFKEITKEVSEKEIEDIKKKEIKLEDIDKKLDEILGI